MLKSLSTSHKYIIRAFFIIALLLASWFTFPLSHAWNVIDEKTFYFLNSWIRDNIFWQTLWAELNSRKADWLYDAVMLAFFANYIYHTKTDQIKRFATSIALILMMALVIIAFNRILFSAIFDVPRQSPSFTFDGCIRLSKIINWQTVKDGSGHCFPGDHGTTVCLFILCMYHLSGWRTAFFATCVSLPFILPRLIVGAHWFSDIVMGSFTIAYGSSALIHKTSLKYLLSTHLEKLFVRFLGLFRSPSTKQL